MGWVYFVLFAVIFQSFAWGKPLTRVIYDDDPILSVPLPLLEKAYGSKIHVLPNSGTPPDRPLRVEGVVLHADPSDDGDRLWIMGDENPLLDQQDIQERIHRDYDLVNIEDKWDEYRFLRHFPEVESPEMHLGSHYTRMRNQPKNELMRLEFLRRKIEETQGRSIVKIRVKDGSEGKLPKTNKNWVEIYAAHLNGNTTLEGTVLEALLKNGNRVIVQSMAKLRKEVRIHIVNGEILPNATFLRYYKVNEYLDERDQQKIHEAIQTQFLDKLPKNLRKINLTPDIIIEQETGRVRFIDLNMGIYSGYYNAEEDLFTANILSERYSGLRTLFQKEWDEITRIPVSIEKAKRLNQFREEYSPLMKGDVAEAFWDRVHDHYFSWLRLYPTSDNFVLCLWQFHDAGLRTATIFHQFIAYAQSRGMRLRSSDLSTWQRMLDEMEPDIHSIRRGDTLIAERRSKKTRSCGELSRTLADAA